MTFVVLDDGGGGQCFGQQAGLGDADEHLRRSPLGGAVGLRPDGEKTKRMSASRLVAAASATLLCRI
jgi:hypothetical protein